MAISGDTYSVLSGNEFQGKPRGDPLKFAVTLSGMELTSLLEYVYATPPMTKAQQGRRGRRLDLVTTIEQHSDEARSVLEQKLADTGKRVPGDDVLRKLRIN